MMLQVKQSHLFAMSGITLAILAWFILTRFLPNGDVSWDLLASQRLMTGGTYTQDFFDLNPPLIFYLYFPAVFLAKISSINAVLTLRAYVLGLSLLSLLICYFSIRRIFLNEPILFSYAMFISLAILLFIFPMNEMAQREHLLIIFTLPYLLIVSDRLQGHILKHHYAIGIGLFAIFH